MDAAYAGIDERGDGDDLQFVREGPGVDSREFEEVVDEGAESAGVFLQRAEIFVGLGEAVLDRFEHRCDRRDRCSEIVAGGGDEFAAGVEQALELGGHRVERASELREFARAVGWSAHGQVAFGELVRCRAQLLEATGDRCGQHERDGHGACGRAGGDREDLHVGAHVEHDPARQQHGSQRQYHGEQPERGKLVANRREAAQGERAEYPHDQGGRRDGQGEVDHGTNL